MIPLPPLALTGGNAGPSTSYGGTQSVPVSLPFVFDNSGWNVQIGSRGDLSAQGSNGAASGTASGSSPGSGLSAIPLPMILLVVGAWLLLK